MIIIRISATNVLKYASLSIDLAEQGLIAISGQNESGKSSIGETVCFALFGRTFSLSPDHTREIIRWGENHCDVLLEFSVEDRRYLLSRFLDRDGNHSAKLILAGNADEPVARGVDGVAEALFGILGFDYDEFVESFYLAQREITTPHPHSQAVKIMAGVAPLEQVAKGITSEIAEREELIGELQAEWDAVDQDVQAIAIQEDHLSVLEDERFESGKQIRQVQTLADEIEEGMQTCADNNAATHRLRGAMGRARFLRFLVLLLALAAAAVWALLSYGSHLAQADWLNSWAVDNVPRWDQIQTAWIGYAAIGLGVVFLLLWMRVASVRRRITDLNEQSAQLCDVLERSRDIDIEESVVGGSGGSARQLDVLEEHDDETAGEIPERPVYADYQSLREALGRGDAAVSMVRDYGDREVEWLHAVGRHLTEQTADLDEVIANEQTRRREAQNLTDVLDGLTVKRADVQGRIDERHRALELLDGAVAHLSSNFNREVKDLVGRLLPLFTDGRYEHLQLDENLRVRVFSSEKRDFMELEEVSSGTQRQIMLAVRLALSKKLLSRTVKGKQFIFLDEPFAFFDEERTRKALQALTNLGDNISQVWIVAQDFPADCDVEFDTKIYCDRSSDVLEVSE